MCGCVSARQHWGATSAIINMECVSGSMVLTLLNMRTSNLLHTHTHTHTLPPSDHTAALRKLCNHPALLAAPAGEADKAGPEQAGTAAAAGATAAAGAPPASSTARENWVPATVDLGRVKDPKASGVVTPTNQQQSSPFITITITVNSSSSSSTSALATPPTCSSLPLYAASRSAASALLPAPPSHTHTHTRARAYTHTHVHARTHRQDGGTRGAPRGHHHTARARGGGCHIHNSTGYDRRAAGAAHGVRAVCVCVCVCVCARAHVCV